jgi:hypothetical protein
MIKFFKKYHKWLGIIATLFILFFSVSGIILNHRELFSGIEISRNILPDKYSYVNWNNAAVKGTLKIDSNNILIYGNIGIWKTDTLFSKFLDFNKGFPKGIDNRKICKLFKSSNGNLFAGSFFGLYQYDFQNQIWYKIEIPVHNKRITDILEIDGKLYVLTRDFLLKTKDNNSFEVITLPEPKNYDNKIGLFKTLWVIHSGEIYGEMGKLIVDAIGIIFAFLSITGLIIFINTYSIRRKRKKGNTFLKKTNKWNLKWHNKIGWLTLVILVITTITGMFLRPPLLISIANSKVSKIPYTELDSPNPWFDKLRRLIYDEEKQRFLLATLDGFYYSDDDFKTKLIKYDTQPPASIMGVNTFEKIGKNNYLIGSFEGLFEWNPENGIIIDHIENNPYITPEIPGSPIGKYLITGISMDYKDTEVYFTFNKGALTRNTNATFVTMPLIIQQQPMSLWNLMLEVHTARIYEPIFGGLYILIIPLMGLIILFILISGFVVWYKKHRKSKLHIVNK